MIGINVSGAEYSWESFATAKDLDYLKSNGVTLIRLPIAWERMQPKINGSLDPTYLAGLKTLLGDAAARGMSVEIDLHNYGHYNPNWASMVSKNIGVDNSGGTYSVAIGSPSLPATAFANFWGQLATALKGQPGVEGFGLMNEPFNMPSPTAWPTAAQAAINAIRAVDANPNIIVQATQGGTTFFGAPKTLNLDKYTDPANKLLYDAHIYFDDGSGRYTQSYDQQGAYPNIGVDHVQPFLNWLKANNAQGFVGEFGVPGDDPKWIPVLKNFISALQTAGVSGTYWEYTYPDPSGKNAWWPNPLAMDPMSIRDNGQNQQLMEVIFASTAPTITSFSPDSGTVGDGATAATTLILTGDAASHSLVQIYDGATRIGTATADANGAWTFATSQLSAGIHSFSATDTDAAGTVSQFSSTLTVTVSSPTGPNSPIIISFSPDSGTVGDGITNSKTLALTGTAEANSAVKIYDGATLIGTATANGSGVWTFATGTLTDGAHSLTAKATDAAGNTSTASSVLNVKVNSIAPNAPSIISFSPDSGTVGDGITNSKTLALTGTAEANSAVKIYDGATLIGTATANGSGVWTFATGTLTDGAHSLTAKATDAAGNTSTASSVLNVKVDSIAPNAPSIISFSPDSGTVGDGITNSKTLALTGTAEANSAVKIYDGATLIGTATANGSGAWTFSTGTLTNGAHSLTAKATDAAGNTSTASSVLNVTVDSIAPNVPSITSISSDKSHGITNSKGHSITNSKTLTLTGTAEANSAVKIYDGATLTGTATTNGSGTWTFSTGTLTDGAHSLTAKATDAAGNTSTASSVLNVTVNSIAPNAPSITSFSPDSGTVGDGIANSKTLAFGWMDHGITNSNSKTLALTGTAEANSAVKIYDGATLIGTATANGSGVWTFATGTLTDGAHSLTAKATDAAGNTSTASSVLNVTVGFENLTGSEFNDTLRGDSGDNVLIGLGGNDKLNGGTGADQMFGGTGNDTYVVNNLGDVVDETSGDGTDTVRSTISFNLGDSVCVVGSIENLTLTGSAAIDGTGNTLDNLIIGNSANNSLIGGGGNDTLNGRSGADQMFGGTGNDTYVVNNSGDLVDETGGDGTDTVRSTISFNLGDAVHAVGGVENLTLTGRSSINGTGNTLDNVIIGNAGNNILTGLSGADWLDGRAGTDKASYTESAAGVMVSLVAGFIGAGGDAEADHLFNIENLEGSNFDDTIEGNAGKNVLAGGLNGVTGDTVSYAHAASGANGVGVTVSLATTRAQHTVTAGTDILRGFENLTGSEFDDTLRGDSGNNVLIGLGGNDKLTGRVGNDTFVFTQGFGKDTITDFVAGPNTGPHDIIEFDHAVFADFDAVIAAISQVGANAVITVDVLNTITLTNVAAADLHADDFSFV